jgi:putative MATE family efflux protein
MDSQEKKKAQEARFQDLTTTPIEKLIPRLALPTMVSMMVTALYNAADTYFVGRISTEATAAVGLVFSIMAIIQALGFFCGHGSGNYLSRMLGSGNKKEASEAASTGFALALCIGLLLAVVGNLFVEPLAYLCGAEVTTLADTMAYMRIILIGAPFMTGQFVLNNQLRFQGSAVYAMIGLLSGAVINVALDPLLILGLHMGVRGAAIATISGQLMSFCILFLGSRKGANIRIRLQDVHFNAHYLLEIVNGGAPSLCRQGLAAVATLLLNHMAGNLGGDAAVAGMSIVTRVTMMMSSALIGFGQGYQPVCSFNYGANIKSRVRQGYFFCVKYGVIFLTVIAVICYIFAEPIVKCFRDDPVVVEVGARALRFQTCVFPVNAVIVMTNMMLQSIGKGVKASIMASARNGICFIPMILILPSLFGLTGVEVSQTCADVLTFLLSIPFAVTELRKMKEA